MKDQVLGLNISLLVHGIILAALFALGQGKMFENKPVVIDLSIVSRDISSGTAIVGPKKNRNANERPALPKKKVDLVSQKKNQPKKPQTVQPKPETTVWKATDPGKTTPTFSDAPVIAPGTHDTMGDAETSGSTPGDGTGLISRGQNEGNPEDVGRNYVNIHFSYLREQIRKNLCYPTIARKMGWSGKVLVGFTILKNGHVDDLEIKKSCGIKLLDNSAMETVRKACPFPQPPALAKIVIPIVYKLN